jgi:hypothetical protein
MSHKNRGNDRPGEPESATARSYEWRVHVAGGWTDVPLSALRIWPGGRYAFRDEHGVVADFPAGAAAGVIRKPAVSPAAITVTGGAGVSVTGGAVGWTAPVPVGDPGVIETAKPGSRRG